jgi:hypothetical protein
MGYQKAGFQFESDSTAAAYVDGRSTFRHNLVQAIVEPYKVGTLTLVPAVTAATVMAKAEGVDSCKSYTAATDIMLENPFNLVAPNFAPKAGSPALGAASFFRLAGFTTTTYVGALDVSNSWLTGWSSFTPQTNVY